MLVEDKNYLSGLGVGKDTNNKLCLWDFLHEVFHLYLVLPLPDHIFSFEMFFISLNMTVIICLCASLYLLSCAQLISMHSESKQSHSLDACGLHLHAELKVGKEVKGGVCHGQMSCGSGACLIVFEC